MICVLSLNRFRIALSMFSRLPACLFLINCVILVRESDPFTSLKVLMKDVVVSFPFSRNFFFLLPGHLHHSFKIAPFIPETTYFDPQLSLCAEDIANLSKWGINSVRYTFLPFLHCFCVFFLCGLQSSQRIKPLRVFSTLPPPFFPFPPLFTFSRSIFRSVVVGRDVDDRNLTGEREDRWTC